MSEKTQQPKQTGFFGNLIFNIAVPVVVMSYLSSDEYLGPAWSIVLALSFPLVFGLYDLKQTKKVNAFSYSAIEWRAFNYIDLNKDQSNKTLEILNALEELDDVQNIFTNANLDIPQT